MRRCLEAAAAGIPGSDSTVSMAAAAKREAAGPPVVPAPGSASVAGSRVAGRSYQWEVAAAAGQSGSFRLGSAIGTAVIAAVEIGFT